MVDVQLDTSYLAGGIASVNFFNGRVLTADDLRDEQAAEAGRHRRLGRVAGEGVLTGLRVAPGPDAISVTVTGGLAVTLEGDVLELPTDQIRVPLAGPAAAPAAQAGATFAPCPAGNGGGILAGPGAYLLVLSPASQGSGQAPLVSIGSVGVAQDCGPRYTVQGVCFRLAAVDVLGLAQQGGMDADDLAVLGAAPGDEQRNRLRNVLAHLFLGTVPSRAFFVDPFRVGTAAGPPGRGPVDELRDAGKLVGSDVPIALLTWTQNGLDILDVWAVRRRPVAGGAIMPAWRALTGPRRAAEGEAAFLQFQDQLARMTGPEAPQQDLADVRAVDYFRYLPAVGLVPTISTTGDGGARGFDPARFFEGMTTVPEVVMAGARLEPLLRAALAHPPIDLSTGELVFLYRVRENAELVESAAGPPPVQPFIVFSSGNLPYQGGAAMEIQAVFPSGPLHPGDAIEIRGHDFRFSQGATRVFFDAIRVDPLPGSSDSKLLVKVPETLQVPEEGLRVALKVDNGVDEDSVTVTVLLREAPLSGRLDVGWSSVDPPELPSGRPASFIYRITARLSRTADVGVTAFVEPAELRPGLELRDLDGRPIEELPAMAIDEVREFAVHLDDVGAHTLTLTVVAKAGDVAGADLRVFEPGAQPEQPDEHIAFQVNSFSVQGTADPAMGTYDEASSTISLRATRIGTLNITGMFSEAGTFDRDLTLSAGATGWQAAFGDVVPDPLVVDDGDLDAGGVAGRPLDFAVLPGLGAAASATVTLTVQRRGSDRSQTKVINLRLLA